MRLLLSVYRRRVRQTRGMWADHVTRSVAEAVMKSGVSHAHVWGTPKLILEGETFTLNVSESSRMDTGEKKALRR